MPDRVASSWKLAAGALCEPAPARSAIVVLVWLVAGVSWSAENPAPATSSPAQAKHPVHHDR